MPKGYPAPGKGAVRALSGGHVKLLTGIVARYALRCGAPEPSTRYSPRGSYDYHLDVCRWLRANQHHARRMLAWKIGAYINVPR